MRALVCLTALLLAGCSSLVPRVEQERELPAFDRVWVMGEATVHVETGGLYGATVVANPQYQGVVQLQVSDGALIVSRRSASPVPGGVEVRVRVPYVTGVSVQGGGSLEVGDVSGPDLEVQLEGAGSVRAHGDVDVVRVELTGSGEIDLTALTCRDCSVRLAGSGTVRVHASARLDAQVEGGGRVKQASGPAD